MSGHAAVSAYGRLTGDPRAIETRTGNPMTVGRLAVLTSRHSRPLVM